ncbi:MAG: 1-acyl-sn-glycerol-3-phosphate acyltransferase [Bacteroidetes bacterium]|nr:1-acyl-sn-glycerol-3-phosphate acyltransferase [Bacteroidota bacterium]MCL6097445.1 1-acyl-sn-glycerol-3-phosphate acyltransferase [Bacteroidota bacterium]
MEKELKYFKHYAEQDEYHTSPANKKPLLPIPLVFFSNLLRIILYSNRFARKKIYNDIRWANSSIDIVQSLERAGITMNFYGMNNLKKVNAPVVFVSNHMSTLETMVLPSIIQPVMKVIYVIKEELARYPLFGTIALARDPILVGRENPREDLAIVLEGGSKKIREGKSIIIFPQKTRTVFFDPTQFNSLGIKLARRNKVPVIPVALISDAWGNGKFIKEVGKIDPTKEVHIAFGEPITVTGNGAEEHQKVVDFISSKFREWGRTELLR